MSVETRSLLQIKPFLDAAEQLLQHDEVHFAIQLLDNLPGYYRDNVPIEILNLKNEILRHLMTPVSYTKSTSDYANSPDHSNEMLESSLRGQKVESDVKAFNDQGIVPNIVDHGPGEFWLAVGLHNKGYKFRYYPLGLNPFAYLGAAEIIKEHLVPVDLSSPTIFVATEIIEHLWYENEIKAEMLKVGLADIVHISTPCYTYNAVVPWRERGGLGHLRTYTPKEFSDKLCAMFPEYYGETFISPVLHARLTLKEHCRPKANQ